MKVEIYADVVCPWCYIGERRFARALAAFPQADRVDVVYRPYQLDPEAPAEAAPLKQYLARRYGALVESMRARGTEAAAAEAIVMNWDRALSVNTLTAHRLLGLAEREHGAEVQRALLDKLFEAHFTRGIDVADQPALGPERLDDGLEHQQAVGTGPALVRRGEPLADVSPGRRTEDRIHDRVNQRIPV